MIKMDYLVTRGTTKRVQKKKQEIEQGMRSARGRETSQISMHDQNSNFEQADEWEDKQEKMLKQKVVLDTHSFWNRTLYCGPTG